MQQLDFVAIVELSSQSLNIDVYQIRARIEILFVFSNENTHKTEGWHNRA